MIGSDPGRVCTGDNGAGRVDKIDIVTADVLDRVDDLLGKSVLMCVIMESSWKD